MTIRFDRYLPPLGRMHWTWGRVALLAVAVFAEIDSRFVPFSRDVDPGRGAEGLLFLILGLRACAKTEPSLWALAAAGLLAALVSALNHLLLPSPHFIWTPVGFFLLIAVLVSFFRGKHNAGPTA